MPRVLIRRVCSPFRSKCLEVAVIIEVAFALTTKCHDVLMQGWKHLTRCHAAQLRDLRQTDFSTLILPFFKLHKDIKCNDLLKRLHLSVVLCQRA